MLRIRSTRLLSGVSAIAVVAAGFGMLSPAAYAAGFTGPGILPPITNAGTDTTIDITAVAVIDEDILGNSITNSGTLTGANHTIHIDDSILLGNILNTNDIIATGAFDGINIANGSVIIGGIVNQDIISGGQDGIEINTSTLVGGISNTQGDSITGVANGILLAGNTVFIGGIANAGTISGGNGINLTDVDIDFIDGISNAATGLIQGTGASNGAIHLIADAFTDGIHNLGAINGIASANGIRIEDVSSFSGGITNGSTTNSTAAITSAGGTAAIWFEGKNGSVLDGGIVNYGSVTGTGGASAFQMSGGTLNNGITNNATGRIEAQGATDTAIRIIAGNFNGGITNNGRVLANATNGVAIDIQGPTIFTGGIINNAGGSIFANSGTAIIISNTTFSGGITNAGSVNADSDAIRITATTFNGGVNNSGRLDSFSGNALQFSGVTFNGDVTNQANAIMQGGATAVTMGGTTFAGNFVNSGIVENTFIGSGVAITSTTFTGSFTNNSTGRISSGFISGDGVRINVATHTGGFTNNGSISGTSDGVDYTATTHTGGNFTNSGTIVGDGGDGVRLAGTAFTGNFSNTGTVTGSDNGLQVGVTTFTGDILNDGDLNGTNDAFRVESGSTVTGSITNGGETGVIISTAQDGVDINGIVNGVENFGTIIGFKDGIDVDGAIGALLNSGTIIGQTEAAIDLSDANTLTTITQDGGLIRGRTTGGAILTALDLRNTLSDVYNASAGTIDGDIFGDAGDDVNVTDALVYLRGTASGLTDITKTGAGTFFLGAASRGDTGGEGVTVGGLNMFHNAGRLYVDDDTTVNMSNQYNQAAGTTLEFYLTSDTTTHGQINAGGEGLFLDGQIAAFVNGTSFGSVGGDTFTYDDVMTGGVSGTFTNAADIITNSLFFEGEAVIGAADVDIILHRLDFADALVLPGMTANENSIANALDAIYDLGPGAGGYGTDFSALFDYLLSLGAGDEALALALYNEISGEEHAQLQQTTLDILNPFNTFMGQRLDAARTTQNGVGFASFGRQTQYAQATSIMTDGASGMARSGSGVSLWARGYGQALSVDGDPEAPGYDQDTGGAVGGIDFMVGRASIIGVAGGWSTTEVDFKTPGDNADVDSWQVGAYGSTGFGRFYLDAELAGAFHDLTTTRVLNLPTPPGGMVAGANYDARSLSAAAEFGAVFRSGNFMFQPNAGLAFTDVDTDTFIESGGGDFNLIVHGSDAQSFATTLGARMAAQFKAGGTSIIPELSVAWRHELDDDTQSFTAAFPDDPASTFNIISSKINEDSALVEAGVTAGVTRNVELFVTYNGLINQDVDVHNGSAGLRATW